MNRSHTLRLFAGLAVLVLGVAACTEPANDTADTSGPNAADTENETADNNGDRRAADPGDALPGPVAALRERGIEIVGSFETATDLTGYAAIANGQSMAIYLTADGKHAVIGTMIDEAGDNLTAPALEAAVAGPRAERAWNAFETDGDWVQDGDPDAPRVVYEITDPNCPFCARFNKLARPWVDAGEVQIRHVMVGVIGRDSLPKAAAIVSADDPAARLLDNFDDGDIEVPENLADDARARIRANNEQMQSLGYRATPTILYRDDQGEIKAKQGMPRGDDVEAILGPRP